MYVKERSVKLKEQLPQVGTGILKGVRVWIDGYLDDTTDIEMKRIVKLAGGEILCVPLLYKLIRLAPTPLGCLGIQHPARRIS